MMPSVSVVVPVYNSAATLRPLVERVSAVLKSNAAAHEIILVDDGSRDDSPNVARGLRAEYRTSGCCACSGITASTTRSCAGFATRGIPSSSPWTMTCNILPRRSRALLQALGDRCDVVYGTARREQHGLFRDLASQLTKIVMQQVLGVESARRVSGFRAFRLALRGAFADFQGPYVNIDVMLTWATSRIEGIQVRHEPRRLGRSNYSFRELMRHALNMLTGFSVLPLRISTFLGFTLTLFGVAALAFVIGRYLVFGMVVPGFAFLASIVIVFSGTQLFTLGVMGEYLARMHFRLLGRPAYAIRPDSDDPGRHSGALKWSRQPGRRLDWDSAFFDVPIGTAEAETPADIDAIEEWAERERIRCLYLLVAAHRLDATQAAERRGYFLTGVRVTCMRDAPQRRAPARDGSAVGIREARASDIPVLQQIAANAHQGTRFYADPHFARESCDRLYETWIRRSCEGWADHVLAAEHHGRWSGMPVSICPRARA